jgi:arylsulfatase A-like enzyme
MVNMNWKRRRSLGIATLRIARWAALSLAVFACSGEPDATRGDIEPRKPATSRPVITGSTNLVFLIIDTLRADKMGCYGDPSGASPELDALAQAGVIFERAIAQCSWTRPSIGSMLTGIYPRTLGLYEETNELLADRFETLAEVFEKRGYQTIGVTANPNINVAFGFDQGFEHYSDSKRGWLGEEGGGDKKRERDFGFWTAREVFRMALDAVGPEPEPPYYIQLNIMEMHLPKEFVRAEYEALFPEIADRKTRAYMQALRQVSADTSAFIAELVALPGMDDTLFVVSSDHGEGLDDHPRIFGGFFHGFLLYESTTRVPLILFHPKGAVGPAVVERPIRNMDLMPTILELFGFEIPAGIDGVSVKTLMDDPEAEVALPAYFVTETDFRVAEKIGVYAGDWKYFENRDNWANMNPRELQPVGATEGGAQSDQIDVHPGIAAELESYLEAWEREHPKSEPTLGTEALSDGEKRQLRELGYLP